MLLSDGAISPIALGDSAPSQAMATYYPSTGIGLTSQFATYGEIYKRQLWVAVLVNKVAMGAARLPFKVYRRTAAGRADATDTPFGQLMLSPNELHDPFFFWLWTVSTFEVFGEAMWLKIRATPNSPPSELWPIHPSNVYTKRLDKDDEDKGVGRAGELVYVFHLGSATVPIMVIPQRDIVHFRSYSPDSQVRGLSRLEPLRQTLINEDAARRATTGFWANGARPATFLTHPKTIGADALQRLRATFDNLHAGVDNYAKTAILEEGMEPHTVSLSAEEAQYIQTRHLNREEACAIYDVPPPVVHILDRATFSNITEQMRSMYRDTMAPRLALFESALHSQLISDFHDGTLYAEFLMDDVLRGDFEARMAAYTNSIDSGIMTPGEIRALENLPDEGPDTNRLYINNKMIPLGTVAGGYVAGQEVLIKPQVAKAISRSTVRTVMGRTGQATTLAELNVADLCVGLNGDGAQVKAIYDVTVTDGHGLEEFRSRLRAAEEATL